jgi:hypothetical protein
MHELSVPRALPGDLDDFDTATEVTSRAKELLLPETSQEDDVVFDVEEELDEPAPAGAAGTPSQIPPNEPAPNSPAAAGATQAGPPRKRSMRPPPKNARTAAKGED